MVVKLDKAYIQEWADARETSIEIAEAIFELAKGDERLAQQIWDSGDDRVLTMAFAKTDKDVLFWGEEKASRGCGA